MRFAAVIPPLVFLAALGCAAQPEIDLEAERDALMSADSAIATAQATSGNSADVIAAEFLEDARLLAPDTPLLQGQEAIQALFSELAAMPGYSLSWSPDVADVANDGDLGYTIGTYEMGMEGPDGPITINGKYMTVWKKQADGSWKVAVDMFNENGPPTPQM